jgi:hypothetical protein
MRGVVKKHMGYSGLLAKGTNREKGQALVLVLVVLLLGSVVVTPLLTMSAGGLLTSRVYEARSHALYAADAGVEDAVWQIKYDHLAERFIDPAYSAFDFNTTWGYDLPTPVNTENVSVTIQNLWMPTNIGIPAESTARAIIQAEKLIVTGASPVETSFKIQVTYYPEPEEDLKIESIGVWLPPGFTYSQGSSNLEEDSQEGYYSVPMVSDYAGGHSIVWSFAAVPFTDFPFVQPMQTPMFTEVSFSYTSQQTGRKPEAVAWVTTSGVEDIPYSWDSDVRVFKILAVSGDTEVDAYITKTELRRMGAAMSGDYRAAGGTLMVKGPTNPNPYDIKYVLLSESDAAVSEIPEDAEVGAAFLYWSSWFQDSTVQRPFTDGCTDYNNWTAGSTWEINSSVRFRGYTYGKASPGLYVEMKNPVDLSGQQPGTAFVSWDQWEGGTLEDSDVLYFAFSSDNGTTWSSNLEAFKNDIGSSAIDYWYTIPSQYLTDRFKLRFELAGFGESLEYCYLDNIAVSIMVPDTAAVFKIDGEQLYLDSGGQPQQGAQPLTATRWQVMPNYSGGSYHGYSYSAYRDITALVKAFGATAPAPAENRPGNGTYTVGSVDGSTGDQFSFAGWSIIIIYTSPQTNGHQLYLYDTYIHSPGNSNIDFDRDGQPGGTISGFLVPQPIEGETLAARLTCFVVEGDNCYSGDAIELNDTALSNALSPANNVWNSRSPDLTADGVDIDTFDINWASGILEPGDTTAQVDIPSDTDVWNIVYIIISFRSQTVTGGALSYLIRG